MAVGGAAAVAYWATAAAAVYSAYSTVQSGKQAALNADAQAEQAQNDANTEKSAAMVQADRIRKMARIQASQANAGLAASGVSTGEGSAININEDIIGNAEQDAAMTVFNSNNRANQLNADASNYKLAGSQAKSDAYGQAAATLISSGSKMYTGWKNAMNTNPNGAGKN